MSGAYKADVRAQQKENERVYVVGFKEHEQSDNQGGCKRANISPT